MIRALVLVSVFAIGCGTIASDRAIAEARDVVARLPCGPADKAPCTALDKTRYFAQSAREYLSEAARRAHHGDHAQAEHFAVLARKSAEEALRLQDGL